VLFRNPLALIFLATIFVPLERVWALKRARVFRPGWRTDVAHFFATHVLEQLSLVIGLGLAVAVLDPLIGALGAARVQAFVATQPGALQFVEALVLIELIGYFMHRAFHRVPALWRIHSVHHSSEHLDWLAALRVHPLDQALTRTAQFVPLYLLGFGWGTFGGLTLVLGLWAIFLHSNVRARFGWLEHVIATPHFHHWHHDGQAQVNFSGLFPFVDRLFGTRSTERAWPASYGCDRPLPDRYLAQLVAPLSPRLPPPEATPAPASARA